MNWVTNEPETFFVSVYRVYFVYIDNILIWLCEVSCNYIKETVNDWMFLCVIRGRLL
jgi:hypothetical protein